MPNHPLKVTRGEFRREIGETYDLVDVAAGETRTVTVDHTDLATFEIADPPEIVPVDKVRFYLRCDGTDGGQFRVDVVIDDDFAGPDYGSGGAGADIEMVWTREGVLSDASV